MKILLIIFLAMALSSCATLRPGSAPEVPALSEYCRVAQRVVTNTSQPVNLIVQADFDGFVRSKATIANAPGAIPEIQQFNWENADGEIVGVSCKLKSADHLNLIYGADTAGPDGACQDMNQYVFEALAIAQRDYAYPGIVFDPREQPQTIGIPPSPGGSGPQWLQPYDAVSVDADGLLVIHTKGFIVDFTDPRFASAPARFRGVHYCHFIAPAHLRALVTGLARPDTSFGREVDLSGFADPSR